MKKRVLTTLLAGALSASMVIPAFAASTGSVGTYKDGTEVWAGIQVKDPDARIHVEVPTLFAFVVTGTVTTSDKSFLSDDDILLPNMKVNVITESDGTTTDAKYKLSTDGASETMRFMNYSTVADENVAGERRGMEVEITGSIKNEDEYSKYNWKHVAVINGKLDPDDSDKKIGDPDEFKYYTLSLKKAGKDSGGNEYPTIAFDTADNGAYKMSEGLTLAAPDLQYDGTKFGNMDDTSKLAIDSENTVVEFGVKVGGQKGQYNQIEESAKIGTIVWTVQSEEFNAGKVATSPSKDPLDRPAN